MVNNSCVLSGDFPNPYMESINGSEMPYNVGLLTTNFI